MKNFFLNFNNSYTIKLFSLPHIIMMLITFGLLTIIILNKDKFKNISEKSKIIIRYAFGIFLIINLVLRRGSFIYYGVYDWNYHLDINFCNFTTIIFILYTFTGNKNILNIAYHMCFIGPLMAIVLPSYNLIPFSYSFISFIIMHHIVFLFSVIFTYLEDIKWDNKKFWQALEFLIIYYSIIFVFDQCFNVSYNLPLTFVNDLIKSTPSLQVLFSNNVIVYTIYIIIVLGLLILGNQVLKIITKRVKN